MSEGINDALIAKQLRPDEHYVDAAYVDALQLVKAQTQASKLSAHRAQIPVGRHEPKGHIL